MLSSFLIAAVSSFALAQEPVTVEIPLVVMYTVPASEKSPAYIVEVPEYTVVDGPEDQDALRIRLPKELTGHNLRFGMPLASRNGLDRVFKSRYGQANCTGKWVEIVCNFKFENLRIDDVARKNYVRSHFRGAERKMVLAAGEKFGNDPIGVGRALGRKSP